MEIKTKVPDTRVRDLLCTGFEGGVGYWCQIVKYENPNKATAPLMDCDKSPWPKYCWLPFVDGGAVICEETDTKNPPQLRLDRAALDNGLTIMAEKFPRHFGNFMGENEDAETGDVFIQCCLLGDIVYG